MPTDALVDALNRMPSRSPEGFAPDLEAALRSAVKAVLPGRQQKRNVEPLIDAARKAFVRTLRRRARA